MCPSTYVFLLCCNLFIIARRLAEVCGIHSIQTIKDMYGYLRTNDLLLQNSAISGYSQIDCFKQMMVIAHKW